MVRDFHRVIGREARAQILKAEGKLPTAVIACVGGGSNAIGVFYEFIKDKKCKLIGVEAGGRGERLANMPRAFAAASPGVLQGTYSYVLQDSGGADCEHAFGFRRTGLSLDWAGARRGYRFRAGPNMFRPPMQKRWTPARMLARTEGIIPALESAHAVAECMKRAPEDEEIRYRDCERFRTRR